VASIIGRKPAGAAKRKKRKTAKPAKPPQPGVRVPGPAKPKNPSPGGTSTDTTTSPAAGTGTTAADESYGTAGALTSATTTAPVPDESGGDNLGGFFSTGTGPALHYHQEDQMAESPGVQDAGASA
jgi:hypothetical protein